MTCQTCEQAPCTCPPPASPTPVWPRSTYHALPLGITKEEFGVDLFEAIRLQASIRQAERTAAVFRKKGLAARVQETMDMLGHLQDQLQAVLQQQTIAPADLRRLLAIQ